MDLISDILLIAGALGAAFYCLVLSRRLSRFTDLDKGVGGAIAVLSAQVDDLTRTLGQAQGTAGASTITLQALTDRAEEVARRLELLVASMHDLPMADPADRRRDSALGIKNGSGPRAAESVEEGAEAGDDDPPIDMFQSRRNWQREAAE